MSEDTKRTLRVIRQRFTVEDDGYGGSEAVYSEVDEEGYPVPYDDETIDCEPDKYERFCGITAADIAVDALYSAGATFWVGSGWQDPDGSRIVDYGTDEREEVSAHPSNGWPADELEQICKRLEAQS